MQRLLRDIETQEHIASHISSEITTASIGALVDAFMPGPEQSLIIGTRHLLGRLLRDEGAVKYLRTFGIDKGLVSRDLFKTMGKSTEAPIGDSRQSREYRAAIVLANALAFNEYPQPNYVIETRHVIEAFRRSPNNEAYRISSQFATNPNF